MTMLKEAKMIPRFASRGLKAKGLVFHSERQGFGFSCFGNRAHPFSRKPFALTIGNTAFALMIALMIRAIGALDGCYDGRTASIITL